MIVTPGSDTLRRVREAAKRIEHEYEARLKASTPQEAVKLRREIERKIKTERRKLILDFVVNRPPRSPVLW